MENLRKTKRALAPFGLLVLRATVGFVMAVHGWMKLADFDAWQANIASMGLPAPGVLAALSMAGELGGGILLMLGLFTPIAALAILVNMIVAVVKVHLPNGLMAQEGGFEYPLVLGVVALYFMVHGGGRLSLDHLLFGRRRRVEPEPRYRTTPYGREVPA